MSIRSSILVAFFLVAVAGGQQEPIPAPGGNELWGWVDLHTHPLANLGFGGKLFYGGVDVGALLPSDPDCNKNVRAMSRQQALGHDRSTHGGWSPFNNSCGDSIRELVIHAVQSMNNAADQKADADGAPDFMDWPVWNDLTHQKMWVDWINRAYQSGFRVMVALAVNNKTLADAVCGPCDYPTDDKNSADLQLVEIKGFVDRHKDFMEIAYTADDLARIVRGKKLAVVLGVEVDNMGNLNKVPQPPSQTQIKAEIDRLYSEGVRYIFPIHVLDNPFGGTAGYQDLFNYSTFREDGHYWNLGCAPAPDMPSEMINYHFASPLPVEIALLSIATKVKLNTVFPALPGYPPCMGGGQSNMRDLTDEGMFAIKEMMRHGMLIDIDHMSDIAKNSAIKMATDVPGGGYPLNSGHAGLRGFFPASGFQTPPDKQKEVNERSMSAKQYRAIAKLHGMAGVGSGNSDAFQWAEAYEQVIQAMQAGTKTATVSGGFGTDTDGFAPGMPPRCKIPIDPSQSQWTCSDPLATVAYDDTLFPKSQLDNQSWDYNKVGVAHYGMLSDFLRDVKTSPTEHSNAILENLFRGAEYFYQTWKLCEKEKANVN